MEKRYYHQFRTIDYRAAVEFYKANKSTLWQEENGEDGEGGEDEDQENDQENREDAVKCENKEQREADTNAQEEWRPIRKWWYSR